MPDTQWFIAKGGQRTGPFTEDQLPALVFEGKLTSKTNVWRKGLPGWKPAGEVPELADYLAGGAPPPAPEAAPEPAAEEDASSVEVGPEAEVVAAADEAPAAPPKKQPTGAVRRPTGSLKRPAGAADGGEASDAKPRRPIPGAPKMSKGKKRLMLALIFGPPLLCAVVGGWLWYRYTQKSRGRTVVVDFAAQWEALAEKARGGSGKLFTCLSVVRDGHGVVPADAKAKFDADLADARKAIADALQEMEAVLKKGGQAEGQNEYTRGLYAVRKDLKTAEALSSEEDRKALVEYPRRQKELMEAVGKLNDEYKTVREGGTPEARAAVVEKAKKLLDDMAATADAWSTFLDKYRVENKTSEEPDPEDKAIAELQEARHSLRTILKELQ